MISKAAKAKGAERKQRMDTSSLMEQILSGDNLNAAYLQVVRNKGAAGVDGMTVEELGEYLSGNGENIRKKLWTRKYKPQPVRRVEIPKPDGGVRKLGVPTVVDRFILLANIMLNELDKELEARGLDSVRYTDDVIIMVGSRQAAERVMKSVTRFIEEKLGLKVNGEKSKIDKPKGVKYLGFGFYFDSSAKGYKARPHPKTVAKSKAQMKKYTRRSWGVSNAYKVEKLSQLIRGWVNYFKIGSMKSLCERLDRQIRYRLRMCIWKHWKTAQNRAKNLIKLGTSRKYAWSTAYTGARIA